ncbi:hypothetical protein GCM10017744_101820 [Streptomyces antimycoticus]
MYQTANSSCSAPGSTGLDNSGPYTALHGPTDGFAPDANSNTNGSLPSEGTTRRVRFLAVVP